jgi:hypothetical protein
MESKGMTEEEAIEHMRKGIEHRLFIDSLLPQQTAGAPVDGKDQQQQQDEEEPQ